jgi:hypothetical protein
MLGMHFIKCDNSFLDTEIALQSEYADDASNTVVLLGGWRLAKKHDVAWYKKQYDKVIVFNQEQLINRDKQYVTLDYYKMLCDADEVWDYDACNLTALNLIRNDIQLKMLRPCKELDAGTGDKTIDVLFYGVVNARRQRILDFLEESGVHVTVLEQVFGEDLVPYIRSAKILLNLHKHDSALQEQARMIRWVSSNATIVSEPSRTNYMGITEVSVDTMPLYISHLLNG